MRKRNQCTYSGSSGYSSSCRHPCGFIRLFAVQLTVCSYHDGCSDVANTESGKSGGLWYHCSEMRRSLSELEVADVTNLCVRCFLHSLKSSTSNRVYRIVVWDTLELLSCVLPNQSSCLGTSTAVCLCDDTVIATSTRPIKEILHRLDPPHVIV